MGTRRNVTIGGPAPGKKSSPVARQNEPKKGNRKIRRKLKDMAGKFGGAS